MRGLAAAVLCWPALASGGSFLAPAPRPTYQLTLRAESPAPQLALPSWLVESFSHPDWKPLQTHHCSRPLFTCGMIRLTLRGSRLMVGAGTCPPGL